MKEQVAVLFLFAMGSIKVYESFGDDDDKEDDYKDKGFHKHHMGRRSVDDMADGWDLLDWQEELVEASNGLGGRGRIDCDQTQETECSCRRLLCFGEVHCQRNLTSKESVVSGNKPQLSPSRMRQDRILRCRQTVLFGENLCECKRYVRYVRLPKPAAVSENQEPVKISDSNQPMKEKKDVGGRFKAERLRRNDG